MKEKIKQSQTKVKTLFKNISKTGICILSKESFSEGTYLNLTFSLFKNEEIQIYDKVKWSRKIDNSFYENGIKFWNISGLDKKRIRKYIENIQ